MTGLSEDYCLIKIDAQRFSGSVAQEYKTKLEELVSCGYKRILLDMSKVEFIDSMGLSVFLSAIKLAGEEGDFVMDGLSLNVARLFTLTRLDRIFTIKTAASNSENL